VDRWSDHTNSRSTGIVWNRNSDAAGSSLLTFVVSRSRHCATKSSPLLDYQRWARSGADPGFLAVSPQVTLVINPAVGCRYFPSGPWLLSQPTAQQPWANYSHTCAHRLWQLSLYTYILTNESVLKIFTSHFRECCWLCICFCEVDAFKTRGALREVLISRHGRKLL